MDTNPVINTIHLTGRLDAQSVPAQWAAALNTLAQNPDAPVILDAAGITYCDGTGLAMLLDLCRRPRAAGATVRLESLPPPVRALLDQFDTKEYADITPPRPRPQKLPEQVGRITFAVWQDLRAMVAFTGESAAAVAGMLVRPASVRWRDVLVLAERAGVDAVPIVALLSWLLGVILAFQSAMPMKAFGAEIYVANLLGLSVLRELGPLMTVIILAGRTGAAFAAEIGTMKVNEEVDALTTMGLDPVRFLVLPRLLAAVAVTPLLVIFSDLVSLAGGAMVMSLLDIPATTFVNQIVGAVGLKDFLTGLGKSLVFAGLIAGTGCLRGLQTRTGASAVGGATTSAVVTSITWIVIADGIFAVTLYHLGI